MYQKLLEHSITSCNDQFFCYLCTTFLSNITNALNHINEKEHQMFKGNQIINFLDVYKKEKPEILSEKKIMVLSVNLFICLPCTKSSLDSTGILQHIESEKHIKNLNNSTCYLDEHINRIKCSINSKKIKVMKKDLIDAKLTFKDLSTIDGYNECKSLKVLKKLNNDSDERSEILMKNGILCAESYRLMCSVCRFRSTSLVTLQEHINAHYNCLVKDIREESDIVKNEESDIVKNEESDIVRNEESDIVRNEESDIVRNEESDIVRNEESDIVRNEESDIVRNEESDIVKNKESDIVKNEEIQDLCIKIKEVKKPKKLNYDTKSEDHDTTTELVSAVSAETKEQNINEILHSNKITVLKSLECDICKCSLPSYEHVLPHIKGKQHILAMQQATKEKKKNCKNVDTKTMNENEKLNVVEEQCTYKETILSKQIADKIDKCDLNINSKCKKVSKKIDKKMKRLENQGVVYKFNNYECTFCKCQLVSLVSAIDHIKGKSHKLFKKSSKFTVMVDDVVCNVKLVKNDTAEKPINKIVRENDIVMDESNAEESSYCCGVCNTQIDIDQLFTHINSMAHTLKQNDQSVDNNVFYKCFCCKLVIQGNNHLVDHLSSNVHLNNLANMLKTIKTTEHRKLSVCSLLIPQVQATSTQFIGKRLIFCNSAHVKVLDDLQNIECTCSLCDVILFSNHSLMHHCKRKMHELKVEQLLCLEEKNSIVNDDTTIMLKQLDNISIAEDILPKTEMLDIDFLVPQDVHTDLMRLVEITPFLVNPKTYEAIQAKPREKSLAERLNKPYCKMHFTIEEEMFTLNKEKLNNIESNLKLVIPFTEKFLFCLACNTTVSIELHILYEHVRLRSHIKGVHEIKRDAQMKKLSEQYMKQTSKDLIKCYPCGNGVFNSSVIIDAHIKSSRHNKNHTFLSMFIDNIFSLILEDFKSVWYSIQRYSCVLCKTGYKYKIEFIQHIILNHSLKTNYVYDFCTPCATLWLGDENSYVEHCSDIVHKYLLKSKDFMIEDLPECIKKLLNQVDETVGILMQQTEILSNDNIHEEVMQSLENTMKLHYPSVKAYLFGSRLIGLASANSDIDIYLDCGDTYYESKPESIKVYLLVIEEALRKQMDEWEITEKLDETRTPILKLIYKRRGVHCDISVTNGLSVEKSKLIRSFIDVYSPCKQLILFVKKWFSLFNLPERHGLANFSLVWLVIFFLQSESCLPSVTTLIKNSVKQNKSFRICGWEAGFAEPEKNTNSIRPFSELLLGFFNFYANFDYQYYVICPLMGCKVAKKDFMELDRLPKEMEPYIEHLKNSKKPEYFRIDSSFCLQDPFDLSHNLTKAVNNITLKYFKRYCQQSVVQLSAK